MRWPWSKPKLLNDGGRHAIYSQFLTVQKLEVPMRIFSVFAELSHHVCRHRPFSVLGFSRVRRSLLIFLSIALLIYPSTMRCAFAGEFPEHWSLVFYVARIAGYDVRDARLISDASWAIDQNQD